ncbi:MAG: S-layer homology domain-containing protein [Selenomonas sp.]|nr:S-layer homology domain-containing protein [Selenomonas sp.]
MKKTLVSALTTALVVGAASTTFAAANPFSDVPADHWAYDAVTQLAADGVVEGYGDTSFKGDKNITRYEMAQIVAKAMAKPNVSGNDKALVDKLAAEFADELNNLGVRVANLERNADKVKWNGLMEYTYTSTRHDVDHSRNNDNDLTFRLEPHAEINANWMVHARIDANLKMNSDEVANDPKLKRVWAEGSYPNLNVKFGKLPNSINLLSTTDDPFSGAAVTFGKALKVTLEAGRLDDTQFGDMSRGAAFKDDQYTTLFESATKKDTANFQAIGLQLDNGGKLVGGIAYEHLTGEFVNADGVAGGLAAYDNGATDNKFKADIWSANASYRFSKNAALKAEYAYNTKADHYNKAGSVQFDYKGAAAANPGSWGMYLAYRHLGQYAAPWSTYGDGVDGGQKGIEVGTSYTLVPNVVFFGKYFNGKDIVADRDAQKLFARVDFFF